MRRCAAKDQSALKALYTEVAPLLLGVMMRILRRRDLAEEGLQDVFVKIWQSADRFDDIKGRAIARAKLNMGPPPPEAIWRLGAGRQDSALPLPPPSLNAVPATPGAATKGAAAAARLGKRKISGAAGRSGGGAKSDRAAEKVAR